MYRGITSTSEHVTAVAMNGDDVGNGDNGGLDSSSAIATSATSIENPFASPSAGIGDAVAFELLSSSSSSGVGFLTAMSTP